MIAQKGQPWGKAELQRLKWLIDGGRTVPEIAKILGRTQEGVRRRAALEGWYASPSLLYSPIPERSADRAAQ